MAGAKPETESENRGQGIAKIASALKWGLSQILLFSHEAAVAVDRMESLEDTGAFLQQSSM